ncbi:MAG: hypothetical protein IJ728_13270 [Selenomonadaceae bacterium]|nr:hypothetical protein [Selenomonadaceae bacterium]
MKIIDAIWEFKNLGQNTIEVELEKEDLHKNLNDIFLSIEQIKSKYKPNYMVIKVITGNPYIGNMLCNKGFLHIETQIKLKAVREDIKFFLAKYDSIFENTVIKKVNDEREIEEILNEVHKGIFYTDRIALDKNFSLDIANVRYANWIKDEVNRGSGLFRVMVEGKSIGFSLRRYDKFSVFDLLAGLYKEYQNFHIGGNIYFSALLMDVNNGYKKFYTSVSSNNLSSLHLHEMFGYKVHFIQEVYVKHF